MSGNDPVLSVRTDFTWVKAAEHGYDGRRHGFMCASATLGEPDRPFVIMYHCGLMLCRVLLQNPPKKRRVYLEYYGPRTVVFEEDKN